jgi:hypothetical protein
MSSPSRAATVVLAEGRPSGAVPSDFTESDAVVASDCDVEASAEPLDSSAHAGAQVIPATEVAPMPRATAKPPIRATNAALGIPLL